MKFGEYINKRKQKMKRLELLQKELEQIKNMKTLSFVLKRKAILYYETEIEAIINYGAENNDVEWINSIYDWLWP